LGSRIEFRLIRIIIKEDIRYLSDCGIGQKEGWCGEVGGGGCRSGKKGDIGAYIVIFPGQRRSGLYLVISITMSCRFVSKAISIGNGWISDRHCEAKAGPVASALRG